MSQKLLTRQIDLGDVQQRSTTMRSLKLEKPTLKITSSCGCTTTRTRDGQLLITYNAPEFPPYLRVKGDTEMLVSKQLTILYRDLTKEIIHLSAKVLL